VESARQRKVHGDVSPGSCAFDEGLKLANPADTAPMAAVYHDSRSGLTAENSVENKRHYKKCIQLERVQVGMS
jgi:hypothetical protein